MLTAPLLAAVAAAAGLSWLAVHDATAKADLRAVRATRLLAVGALALVAWCAWTVAGERPALAEADLAPGATLEVPATEAPPVLLVRGELPPVGGGESAAGTFELEVRGASGLVGRYDGTLGEQWKESRAGRSGQTRTLIVHDEERFALPEEAHAQPLQVRLTREEGDLEGPLHVAVLTPPPGRALVGGLGVALTLAAAVADRLTGGRSRTSLWVALLGAFSVALLDGITPHSSPLAIAGAGLLAVMLGLPAWLVVRGLVAALPGRPAPAAG